MCSLWAASTDAAYVTNASFKSSLVPLQTTLLACEPSERASKETAAGLVVRGITGQPYLAVAK